MEKSSETFEIKKNQNYVLKIDKYETKSGLVSGGSHSSHTVPEINYFLSGKYKYKIGDTFYDVSGGDVFVIPAGELHRYEEVSECGEHINIWFDPLWVTGNDDEYVKTCMESFAYAKESKRHRISRSGQGYSELANIIINIFDESQMKKNGCEYLIRFQLIRLGILFSREIGYNAEIFKKKYDKRYAAIDKTMVYICDGISQKFTLEKLAKIAYMSPGHYCAVFKEINGITPWEFITSKKIDLASELLKNTNKAVIDIAFECGFSNSANFNRAFKKYRGMTPGEYRKTLKSE